MSERDRNAALLAELEDMVQAALERIDRIEKMLRASTEAEKVKA